MPNFSHGRNARFLADGFDLSDSTNKLETNGTSDLVDITGFQNGSKRFIAGYKEATMKASGFFRGTIGGDQPAISTDVAGAETFGAGTVVFSHYPAGVSIGSRGVSMAAQDTTYNVTSDAKEANAYSIEAMSSVGVEPVISHYAIGTATLVASALTASGTAASVNNAAASTNGGAGYLHSFRLTAGTAIIKLQHSADDATFADLAVLGTVVAATDERLSARVAIAGTIDQYTRCVYTVTGGSAAFHAGLYRA